MQKSLTSFCVTAVVLLIFGLVAHDNFPKLFIALGIMLLTLIILHPEDFLCIFHIRRKSSKKKQLGLTGTLPKTKLAAEAVPVEVNADLSSGKE